jgi:tripartite-type tricarboxylate transporter receptor subunit TctC
MFTRTRRLNRTVLAAVILAGPAVAIETGQSSAADFYKGKRIKLTVGSSAGGGYDTYTRALGRHIVKYIPGTPKVTVQNMQGGGGLKSVQYTYQVAKKDGTEFANIRASNMLDGILGIRGGEFEADKFNWIGNMASDTDVCMFWHKSGVRTFDDLIKKKPRIGATGKGAQAFMFPNAINSVLGTEMKIILGYKGTSDRILAVEQGELEGSCGINGYTFVSRLNKHFTNKTLIPLMQSGLKPNPLLKDVPMTQSFAKTKEQKDILDGLFSQMAIARPYAAPPGVPADRVKILRTAFAATMKDAAFLKEAAKLKIGIDPSTGEETEAIIRKLASMSPTLKQKIKKAIGQ